jgi:DNA-binding MarR family transcriptional regulator
VRAILQTRRGNEDTTSFPQTLPPLPVSEFQILLALADEERHGYAIMREVATRTDGDVQLGPGTLYGAIKRMVSSRLIEESDERPDPDLDDERRRYYRITALGRRWPSPKHGEWSDSSASRAPSGCSGGQSPHDSRRRPRPLSGPPRSRAAPVVPTGIPRPIRTRGRAARARSLD